MTEEKSKSIGFRTPSTELQERFDDLFLMVDGTEKSWGKLGESATSIDKEVSEEIKKSNNAQHVAMLFSFKEYLHIMNGISVLGMAIARTERRVVGLEKSIEKLHLKVK